MPDESNLTPAQLAARLPHAGDAGRADPVSRRRPATRTRTCAATARKDIRRLADDGAGVILGRGAAVVLGKDHGFHVRLDGPPQARVAQGAEIEGISVDQARRHLDAADRARDAYVRRLYRADPADPRHYHLVIDSTALPLDAVIEIILRALSRSPGRMVRSAPTGIPPRPGSRDVLPRCARGAARGGFRSSPGAGCARRRARRRRPWRTYPR